MGNSSNSKRVTKGCPQGLVSVPTVWNIIIIDLIALLSDAPNRRTVVFADDIMIIDNDTGPLHPSYSHYSPQDWCNEHRLEISKDKSALMPMFIRNRKNYKRHPVIVAWGINSL
jgi:hypothetical protein